jgi:hypothetical protein
MICAKCAAFALCVAVAISAAATAMASASQWLLDDRPIANAVALETPESLLLADLATVAGTQAINCDVLDRGRVGPGDKGETTELDVTSCSFQSGDQGVCEASGSLTVAPLNLPWLTLLLSVGGVAHDMIFGDARPLGWQVTCSVVGVLRVVDECTSASIAPDLANLPGGVDRDFLSEVAGCSAGTSTSGMVLGTGLAENPKGHTLSVSR